MGSAPAPSFGNRFEFSKDGQFLENHVSVGIVVEAPKDTKLALALAGNDPFPPGTIHLAQLSASVTGDSGDIHFGSGAGVVSFQGTASGGAGLGVYGNTADLIADLDPQHKILQGFVFNAGNSARLVALHWDYELGASLNGSVALGVGASITFGADGSTSGFFAVVRGFSEDPQSRDAVAATVSGWMLPRQVTAINDLAPGTWLIAEVDGQFSAKLGVQYGFDQTWIRNVNLSGLSGPVGLRVQASVDASLGFHAAGKYLLVVARESTNAADRTVRMRLYKMATKGLDFAFDAGVDVTPQFENFLPVQLDDFLAGILGLQGSDLVQDLADFREWIDPSKPLPERFASFVSQYVTNRFSAFVGDKVNEARRRIQSYLDAWHNLPNTASALLWSEIRKGGEAARVFEQTLRAVASSDDSQLQSLIETELSKVQFFASPLGKWIESTLTGSVLSTITNSAALVTIRDHAKTAVSVLDGSVLQELVDFVDKKLRVDLVQKALDMATFDNLEKWLQQKIQDFIGRVVDLSGLEEARKTLEILTNKADAIYAAARKALTSTYSAAIHATYSSSTTRDALLDVNFDFAINPGAGPLLRAAINGDLNDILLHSQPGVTINSAVLTHGIKRQSHVQIVLPHFDSTIDHINESLATMEVNDENGRLFLYELNAKDEVIAQRKSVGSVVVTGKIPLPPDTKVRVFTADHKALDEMTFTYRLRQAFPNMRALQLQNHVEPLVPPYFPRAFGGPAAPDKASLSEWVGDLDNFADEVERRITGTSNGTGLLGNTLLSLEVSVPGRAVAAWLNAPSTDRDPAYMDMSRRIQAVLRRVIPYCYFSDPKNYVATNIAGPVIVYQCLPVSTSVKVTDDRVLLDQDDDVYWDFRDIRDDSVNQRVGIVFKRVSGAHGQVSTATIMSAEIARIRALLTDTPGLRSSAASYDPGQLSSLMDEAIHGSRADLFKNSLLFIEAEVIEHAREAGLAIAAFRQTAGSDPAAAIKALSAFGSKVGQAFHNSLGSLFSTDRASVREFSSVVFLEASQAFDPALSGLQPAARLDVMLLRRSAPASVLTDFIADGTLPDATQIAIEQPVVGVPA